MIYVPDGSDSVEFWSLPVRIREFVNSVRENCLRFGSASGQKDLNGQIGQVSFVDQEVPEDSEDREYNEKQNLLILSMPEQNIPKHSAAAFETSERQRKGKGKKAAYEDFKNSESSAASRFGNQTNRKEVFVYENPEGCNLWFIKLKLPQNLKSWFIMEMILQLKLKLQQGRILMNQMLHMESNFVCHILCYLNFN